MADLMTPPAPRRKPAQPRRLSLEAYFKAEDKSLHKHEYHNGTIKLMPGAKLSHNLLAQRMAAFVYNFIEEQDLPYLVSNSDTKIRIEAIDKVVYPDAVVICDTPVYYDNREERQHVSVFTRQPDTTWLLRDYDGNESTAVLYALHNRPLSLKRLYRGLLMPPAGQ